MKNLVKIMMVIMVMVAVAGVIGVGSIMADEHKYEREVSAAEEAVEKFNESYEGVGARKVASFSNDWSAMDYGITVRMYTEDGAVICTTSYDNVDAFIEAEF